MSPAHIAKLTAELAALTERFVAAEKRIEELEKSTVVVSPQASTILDCGELK